MSRTDDLPHSPAAERNLEPIAAVLERWLPRPARVLEIGSGTGQHAVGFQRRLPGVTWQASDRAAKIGDLERRFRLQAPELPEPVAIDVAASNWPAGPWDAVFTANTLHIMPWPLSERLISQASAVLAPAGLLIIYGPFHEAGHFDTESNRDFDRSLRAQHPNMGLRDVVEIRRLAAEAGFDAEAELAMPANNRTLIYRRSG
jgi:SAM-dependent methyltransferase